MAQKHHWKKKEFQNKRREGGENQPDDSRKSRRWSQHFFHSHRCLFFLKLFPLQLERLRTGKQYQSFFIIHGNISPEWILSCVLFCQSKFLFLSWTSFKSRNKQVKKKDKRGLFFCSNLISALRAAATGTDPFFPSNRLFNSFSKAIVVFIVSIKVRTLRKCQILFILFSPSLSLSLFFFTSKYLPFVLQTRWRTASGL